MGDRRTNRREEGLRKADFSAVAARTRVPRECLGPPNGGLGEESGRAHGLTFEEIVVLVVAGAHCAAEERRGGSNSGIGGTRGRRCRGNPRAELQLPDRVKNPSLPLRHFRQAPAPKGKYFREAVLRPRAQEGRCAGALRPSSNSAPSKRLRGETALDSQLLVAACHPLNGLSLIRRASLRGTGVWGRAAALFVGGRFVDGGGVL